MSETYLDSSIPSDDSNLKIPGYDLIRVDHPSNSKRGGVCVYYRNSPPLKILDIFYLQECIVFELKVGNKSCKIVSLYRSPNQWLCIKTGIQERDYQLLNGTRAARIFYRSCFDNKKV